MQCRGEGGRGAPLCGTVAMNALGGAALKVAGSGQVGMCVVKVTCDVTLSPLHTISSDVITTWFLSM